jgi:N-sulfoglucosamine sulfohydrolase
MNYFSVLFVACLAVSLTSASTILGSPPNILLIISEDHGPELSCYGDPYARTPHLDHLAEGGVLFERAFVTQAGCSQSRASILTGLYPHQHGQIGLATWNFRMYDEETPNIPRSLKAVGYRTGIVGKLHVNPGSAFPYDFQKMPKGNFSRNDLAGYARHAESFMRGGDEPFFLHVNYPDAHDPFLTQVDGLPEHPLTTSDVKSLPHFGIDSPELRELVADYYNCISRLDSLIGDLLSALDRSGKSDNTLVIFLADHGVDLLRGKRSSYEAGTRVPMIVRWPGKAEPQVRRELVSTIDLMPTLLQVGGAEPIPSLPGLSLVPIFSGERPEWREDLFTEFHTHAAAANFFPQRTVRDARYKLIENLLPDEPHPDFKKIDKELPFVRAVVAEAPELIRDAYQRQRKPPRYELYDLQDDPFEFRDLSNSPAHAGIFADMKRRLARWRERSGDPLLDEAVLQRLKAEVTSMPNKSTAKESRWGYPDYFFGREPAATPLPRGNR